MGQSSIQMTMRYAHLAPQHDRAAVDRLVHALDPNRRLKMGTGKAKDNNELVTKSATGRKLISGLNAEVENKLQ